MAKEFIVSAHHRSPEWRLDGATVKAIEDTITGFWYCNLEKFGCGRDYDTPEQAIRELLYASGCSHIEIDPAVN